MAVRHEYAVTLQWMLDTATPLHELAPAARAAVMRAACERFLADHAIDDDRMFHTEWIGTRREDR